VRAAARVPCVLYASIVLFIPRMPAGSRLEAVHVELSLALACQRISGATTARISPLLRAGPSLRTEKSERFMNSATSTSELSNCRPPAGRGTTRVAPGLMLFIAIAGCNAAGDQSADTHERAADAPEVLQFSIREGRIYNHFYREGPVAAHTVLTSGTQPRLIVAFPAGNSGVSLWFEPGTADVYWPGAESVHSVQATSRNGATLYGIESDLAVDNGPLIVRQAVLGNVRVIRNYLHQHVLPAGLESELSVDAARATWYRDRLDGDGGYSLSIEVLEGSLDGGVDGPVTLRGTDRGRLRLRITALSGDEPLTPIERDELLTADANDDALARNVLEFLSYQEKLLAGSWRFCTYFGRDTLMSIRLMMPVLTSTTIEAGLGSVLARLAANGEVAHEEDIGEYAVLRNIEAGRAADDTPIYDYHMVDDDYMLAPIAAHYLLDHPAGRARAAAFLHATTPGGRRYGDALVSNLQFVTESASSFASEPTVDNLIRLKPDSPAGDWRDSREGLGYGRIPYDVNAVFVPAAVAAVARLHASGLLDDFAPADTGFERAGELAAVWRAEAPRFFSVRLSSAEARRRLEAYATGIGVPLLAGPEDAGDLTFNAVSLDVHGVPIPVMHSDDGFALLFADPEPAELERIVSTLLRPFPSGLLTPVGMVVANPAYASPEQRRLFTSNHYHGTTVWSWQQALMAAGLARQLERNDLPAALRAGLVDAQQRLWHVIETTREQQNSELWSWSYSGGNYRLEPFGQRSGDETESNAAQLWSTVFLGIAAPRSVMQ